MDLAFDLQKGSNESSDLLRPTGCRLFHQDTCVASVAHQPPAAATVQVFCRKQWDLLLQLLPYVPFDRPAHVLDAGANIGLASLLFTPFLRHLGTITAVDASPPTFHVLRQNLRDIAIATPVLAAVVPDGEAGGRVAFGNDVEGHFWGARVHGAVKTTDAGWLGFLQRAMAGSDALSGSARANNTTGASGEDGEAMPTQMFEVPTVSLPQLAVRARQPPHSSASCKFAHDLLSHFRSFTHWSCV